MFEEHIKPMLSWIVKGEIVGLVDEEKGGIIGYIHRDNIKGVIKILSKRTEK